MPFEDGQWDEREPGPLPASRASLGSTSGPGETPEEVFYYDEDRDGGDRPTDLGPHPDTQAQGESAQADNPVAPVQSSEEEPLPEFDRRVRQDFEGLLYLGYLEDEFEWVGHRFKIRTLYTGEILQVGLLHRRYVGTLADVKAYQAAITAACVMQVDGKSMPTPLTNDPADTGLGNRFDYVLRSWFPPTLDVVYERYLLLEKRVRRVLDAMGKASGSTELILTSNGTSS